MRSFIGEVYGPDLHAKRVDALAGATLGVMAAASLAVAMIGQALAQARGLVLTSRLDDLIAEDREVLRTGLATAGWVTVDDTAARHARQNGFTTQIGDDRFTTFRTGASKSRLAFLSTLRAGHGEYVINEAALEYMRGRALAGPVIDLLAAHPVKVLADAAAWTAHLAGLGIDRLPRSGPGSRGSSSAAPATSSWIACWPACTGARPNCYACCSGRKSRATPTARKTISAPASPSARSPAAP